jgi:hypothetical protein
MMGLAKRLRSKKFGVQGTVCAEVIDCRRVVWDIWEERACGGRAGQNMR